MTQQQTSTESWVLRTGLSAAVWALAAVATALAASGQVQFARWAGIRDVRAYAVPAILELVAVAFLLLGYRRARRGDSPMPLWTMATLVGGFSVYTNIVHGGPRAGLVFGAASAITMVLWFVKLHDDSRQHRRRAGQTSPPRPKFGALWLVAPRLSARAWMIAARRRLSTVDEAVGLAEIWQAVFQDARQAAVSSRLARRTAWRSVAEAAGTPLASLPRTAEIASVSLVSRAALMPVDAGAPRATGDPPGSPVTAPRTEPSTDVVVRQRWLTPRRPGPAPPQGHYRRTRTTVHIAQP